MKIFIPFSFLLWVFAFRGFFSGELAFTSDAISYYNHIQFFIRNLAEGVFPLWDPLWNTGVPNDFFLRRFGAFNPSFLLILIPYKLGFSYLSSYLFFLAGYYFIGMLGFYALAKRIFNNTFAAFTAYLLLMFSSLGTRLFDSYLLLMVVPMIWFFYCLVRFNQTGKKHFFIGITFTLMVLSSTYIPFYFFLILGTFLMSFGIVYFKNIPDIARKYILFLKKHKVLSLLCAGAVMLALLPGILFMRESAKGEMAFPQRHSASIESNQVAVGLETITSWGMLEDIAYSVEFLKDITKFKFAVLYVPPAFCVILLGGLFIGMTKRLIFFFLWGISLFIMFSPYAPVYNFLHKHIFFFRYFRNLHFFLWIILLPIFILFVAEQFNVLLKKIPKFQPERVWVLTIVLVLITAHPLITYYYLNKNSDKQISYVYDQLYKTIDFMNIAQSRSSATPNMGWACREKESKCRKTFALRYKTAPSLGVYYATKWARMLSQQVSNEDTARYLKYKFYFYDKLGALDNMSDFKVNEFQSLKGSSQEFQILDYDVNSIKLKTNFNEEKFLVYNDSFHSRWQAFLNGQKTEIIRAQVAFKGVLLPAGENIVYFRYGAIWLYVWNYFLMAVFYGIFSSFIFLWVKDFL